MRIAVFDVCGTIYQSNTTFDFIYYIYRASWRGKIWKFLIGSLLGKALGYVFSKYFKLDIYRETGNRLLKRFTIRQIKVLAAEFVQEYLAERKNEEVIRKMEAYRAKGYQIVLMSASYDFIIEQVASSLQANAYFGSRLKSHNDRYIGGYHFDLKGKKKQVLEANYPQIERLAAISDNQSDLQLLAAANEAFVIINNNKKASFWKSRLANSSFIFP